MESFRLKNIAILILLLLNLFLLLLLGSQQLQARRSERETTRQLRALFSAEQLTLSEEADLFQDPLPPLALSRDTDTEAAMAAALLGGEAEAESLGGGIYTYETGHGSIQFRAGGSFESGPLTLPAADAEDFARQFCKTFGYGDLSLQLAEGGGTVSAVQYVAGVPVSGCGLSLTFEDGLLTAASGSHVELEDAAAEEAEVLSCATALVRFLDYRSAAGVVCSQVRGVSCVYVLQSTSAALRLLPVWQLETDAHTYLVDASTGAVSHR